jgi:hypothetical protein
MPTWPDLIMQLSLASALALLLIRPGSPEKRKSGSGAAPRVGSDAPEDPTRSSPEEGKNQ